ncbi:MAG: hypothetical protein ABI129_03155 [Rhodanobacter sp.]
MSVPRTHALLVERIAKNHLEVEVRLSPDTTAAALCPSGNAVYLVTHGGCSCDICFEASPPDQTDTERHRAKLKNKGWSHAKIERAISEGSFTKGRNASLRADSFQKVVNAFQSLASEIAVTSPLTLFRHMYHGAIATEQLSTVATSSLPVADFSAAHFPPDTIVHIGARQANHSFEADGFAAAQLKR